VTAVTLRTTLLVKAFALASILAAGTLASPAPAPARAVVLGRSWQGRPIRAVQVGNPAGTPVLVVGAIHGDEAAGIAVARALERSSPHDLDLWIVPDLNPDGVAAGTRGNAHGVDLNRNFPWRWRPMSGVYASGTRPLSEREARIAHALILRLHPHVTIWFHQHLDMVWASGGDRRVEKTFARVSGLPYHPMPQLAGSAVSWQNNALRGTTAFAAELPAGAVPRARVARYARAVLAAARTDRRGRHGRRAAS
jgi:protein MpaA